MKPFLKKDKASGSTSEESSSQRPKRSTCLKNIDGSNGLLWREETDLKRALYASLQETRKRNLEDEEVEDAEEVKDLSPVEEKKASPVGENGQDEILKKAKVHAQRKFAQGSTPNSPVPTPVKVPFVNNSTKELLPYRRPKTEDFLTFLCLRGTSILPPSLDFLNCCSKSDSSSECRSLSPDLETKDYANHKESTSKISDPREKNSARHENLSNGVSRKLSACKASSKKHTVSSQTIKKTSPKSQKEASIVRKRKSRDDNEDVEFIPTNSSSRSKSSTRTRSSTMLALREKYKKQRLASDKKKVPAQTTASPQSTEVKSLSTRSQSAPKRADKTASSNNPLSKKQNQSVSPVLSKKVVGAEQKLAVEKRKSLRSAQPSKGFALRKSVNKKTMWLRRAKMVPPIVDVESDSEPEIIAPPAKKTSPTVVTSKQEKTSRLSERLREKIDTPKVNTGLTSRQILLRKLMQNRLAAKKSVIHSKNVKSKTIVKHRPRQIISKKVMKKSLVSKTMSLRKDLQNKRVTRSAKHQIEELLWSNPEKRSKFHNSKSIPASRIDKKRISSDEQQLPKKSKLLPRRTAENKEGKNSVDKESKVKASLNNDNAKINKPANSTKVIKRNDAIISTRSSKILSHKDPKPSSSSENLHCQPKTENVNIVSSKTNKTTEIKLSKSVDGKNIKPAESKIIKPAESKIIKPVESKMNKSATDSVKKEAPSDIKKYLPKSSNNVDLEDREKIHQLKKSEEFKCSNIKVANNINSHADKEKNVKSNVMENNLGNKNTSLVTSETNVQNNLNFQKCDKNLVKDISKLINLNVDCEEPIFSLSCKPSCSGVGQKEGNKKLNLDESQELNSKSELLLDKSFIKKHYDPKYIKNAFKENKLKKTSDKSQKIQNKTCEGTTKSHKDLGKEYENIKSKSDVKTLDKSKLKKEMNKQRRKSLLWSDSDSSTDIAENSLRVGEISKIKNKKDSLSKEKMEIKKNRSEKGEGGKRSIKLDQKRDSKKSKVDILTDSHGIIPKSSGDLKKQCESFCLKNDSQMKGDRKDRITDCSIKNSTNTLDLETDDSDNDLTIGDYLKLKTVSSEENISSNNSLTSKVKETGSNTSSASHSKMTKKEIQKSKKEGESSKHKKEKSCSKEKSSEKSFKKEDKMSRRDSEKSISKLLKRERSKSNRKEEKLKHKRDGSSSSKSSKDKDGSKLNRKEGDKESSSSEKKVESKNEFSDSKKEKSSKKDSSKLSRSNSYEETKSPKKKRKLNDEFKQIEEIKNFISNSSVLNEISEFKRRLSADKSEFKKRLSKSKKRKKLALLKEKKLSKKLSSKLLRKYSKKKGLKKKNKLKLKKKELKKECKLGTLSTKVHSKNKNKKHKTKSEHKKDNQEKGKGHDKTLTASTSTETVFSSNELPHVLTKEIPNIQTHKFLHIIPEQETNNVQTCTGDIVTPSIFATKTVTPAVEAPTINIPRRESSDKGFPITEENTNDSVIDLKEIYPSETVLQTTRNSMSQVPLHFVTEIPSPAKTMADAATNTCDDDIDETLSPIPELMRNVEMSVGTQTITPVGSPSPTAEMKSIVPSVTIPSPLVSNLRTNCINLNIPVKSPTKLSYSVNLATSTMPDKLNSKCANNAPVAVQETSKSIGCFNNSILPVPQSNSSKVVQGAPIAFSSTSSTNAFSIKSGKQGCVNVLPVSPEKSKMPSCINSSSLTLPVVIPTVTTNVTKSLIVVTDGLPNATSGPVKPILPITPGKSSSVTSCAKTLICIISPEKPTLKSSHIGVNSPLSPGNHRVVNSSISNPFPSMITEKSKLTNSVSNPACAVVSSNVTSNNSPTFSVALVKSMATCSVSITNSSKTPEESLVAKSTINPICTVTTAKNTVNSSYSDEISEHSNLNCVSNPTLPVVPGKSKVSTGNCNASQPGTPSKSKSLTSSASPGHSSSTKVKKRNLKKMKSPSVSPSKHEAFPLNTAKLVSAPVYYPQAEEFNDPLEYISKIRPEAEQYGICKIVPPSSFKPECKVNDDMRFTAHNQYLHKMLHRWGPNVQHTTCIRKHLKTQKVKFEQPPLIGGIELDVSKFYHTVQQFGGLQQVIEKKKWQKVADVMRVPKTAQDRVTKLYDAYCKYLVSYDTLPSEEKQKIEEEVIAEHKKHSKLRNSPNESEKEDEEMEDENNDCVSKGRSMSVSNFFRIARNTMTMWFKNEPSPEEVENEFWKVVTERQQHVVVHAGNIDSSVTQSGFPTNKSPFAKHPWNLKILTNNSRSILKSMGPLSGITIPTLHVGMLFTTGCWYRDPHSFPWIEYLHTGASKIWYGIPANGCEKFRTAMRKIMPEYCTTKPLWLSSDTAMVPPDLLVKHGASLSRTIQNSGQFIVIFPEAFTSTICCGYCVSESVYFAPTSWLDLAVKAFQDIRNSCESPAFSLDRLLFSIGNDPKPQLKFHLKTLQKILPMIENIRHQELHLRAQLNELGLKQFERLPLLEVRDKKKKSKSVEEESEQECEVCRTPCYVSMVIYPQEDSVYCLPHAIEHIQKKNFKMCKLKYTYSEHDLNELIKKITDIVSQLPDSSAKKKSAKKKTLPITEK